MNVLEKSIGVVIGMVIFTLISGRPDWGHILHTGFYLLLLGLLCWYAENFEWFKRKKKSL